MSRALTGRPGYRHYVEFDVLPGETLPVGGIKRALGLGRYQQFVPSRVALVGRNPEFGVMPALRGEKLILPAGIVAVGGGGYAVYKWLDDD